MAFDATPGGYPCNSWCKACRQPIEAGQAVETVQFDTEETRDMSGLYHRACAKPFASMARALNILGRAAGL
jgi:hypothetical protein